MSNPIRSMTGYGTSRRATGAGELIASLRTVNHRGLDLHFHLPAEFASFESAMRERLKASIGRGHVEIRMHLSRAQAVGTQGLNGDALNAYVQAFREAAKQLDLVSEPDLNVLIGLPGVITVNEEEKTLGKEFGNEVLLTLEACLTELNGSREREGAALAAHINQEVTELEMKTAEIERLREGAAEKFAQRLRERLNELLSGAVNESRIAEEAALLANRSDIQEEVTRLHVHAREMRRMLSAGGEVGKRIDFLVQEMNRETNTVLSKTSGMGEVGLKITALGLGMKAHIDKVREQALNLE